MTDIDKRVAAALAPFKADSTFYYIVVNKKTGLGIKDRDFLSDGETFPTYIPVRPLAVLQRFSFFAADRQVWLLDRDKPEPEHEIQPVLDLISIDHVKWYAEHYVLDEKERKEAIETLRLKEKMPRLLLPGLSRFDQLFDRYSFDKNELKEPPCWYGMPLGPYCMVRSTERGYSYSVYVYPTKEVVEAIHAHMMPVSQDQLHFEIIIRDEEALVVVSHGQIIGSRWIAEIDPATIPKKEEG